MIDWLVKYTPRNLDDFIGMESFKKYIINLKNNGEKPPNMLFVGVPSTGKTTMAKIIASLFTSEDYVKYVNASDNTGVDFYRKLDKFLYSKTWNNNLKVLILDEFDYTSDNAQALLRGPMYDESISDVIFILTANNINKINPAIVSRCKVIQFKFPSKNDRKKLIERIIAKENIYVADSIKELLVESDIDYRTVIRLLHLYHIGKLNYENMMEYLSSSVSYINRLLSIQKIKEAYDIINDEIEKGTDPAKIVEDLLMCIIEQSGYDEDVLNKSMTIASKYNNSIYRVSIIAAVKLFMEVVKKTG